MGTQRKSKEEQLAELRDKKAAFNKEIDIKINAITKKLSEEERKKRTKAMIEGYGSMLSILGLKWDEVDPEKLDNYFRINKDAIATYIKKNKE